MTGSGEEEQRETRPQRLRTGRHHPGTLGDIKSERWATSSRNDWATSSEYAGWVIDRFSFKALAVTYAVAAVAVAAVGLSHHSVGGVTVAIFAAGFCIVGGQIAANALASGAYPTTARATGVGWALGIGRVGSIVGPLVGGLLLSLHWSTEMLFGVAAIPALFAAVAALVLSRLRPAQPHLSKSNTQNA